MVNNVSILNMMFSKATINTLTSILPWILYLITPVLVFGYLLGDPILSAIIEYKYWYLLLIFIAGMFDGIKDTLSDHFSVSIFKKLNTKFWDKSSSSEGRKILGMRFNAWHISKMLQTLFICLAIIYFIPSSNKQYINYVLVYGFYKWGFNLFYSCVLVTKGTE